MKPSEVSQALRNIADRIERSKQPHASAVEQELRTVMASIKKSNFAPPARQVIEDMANEVMDDATYDLRRRTMGDAQSAVEGAFKSWFKIHMRYEGDFWTDYYKKNKRWWIKKVEEKWAEQEASRID